MKVPKGWRKNTLQELFKFQKKSKIKAGASKHQGKYKFFTSSPRQTKFIDKYNFNGEYLIFATGGHAGLHYCNEKFSTSTDCFVVKVSDQVITKYIYYYLLDKIQLLENGFKGAGLKHISKKYIQNLEIYFPENKEIQKKIVLLLEKAEQAKEWRKEVNCLTEEFLRSVFSDMFGDPSKITKWEIKPLKEFGKIITGNTPSRKNKKYYGDYIDWVKSDNLNHPNTYVTISSEKLSKKGAEIGRIIPKDSILVTCIAGSLKCIGNAGITTQKVAFNQQMNAIIPNNKTDSHFLYYLILNSKNIIQRASTKSMKGMISKSKFELIKLPLPPLEIQKDFALIVKEVEKIKVDQKKSKEELENLFNALMQKAFKGELKC